MRFDSILLLLASVIAGISCRSEPANVSELQAMLDASHKSVVFHTPKTMVTSFSLIDDQEKRFTPNHLRNKWTLMLVGYTSCPDVCPTALSALAKAIPDFIKFHPQTKFQFIFLAVDPSRDTAIDLHQYAGHFHSDIRIVSGESNQIDHLVEFIGASYQIPSDPQGFYTVDHSTSLFVIDPNGHMIATVLRPHSPSEILNGFANIYKTYSSQNDSSPRSNQIEPSLSIDHAWVLRPPPNARVAAGFGDIHNLGGELLTIVGFESPQFETVELHDITEIDGVAKMVHISQPKLQAGKSLTLRPGAKHFMFIGPKHGQIMQKDFLQLTTILENGKKYSIKLPIQNENSSLSPPKREGKQ